MAGVVCSFVWIFLRVAAPAREGRRVGMALSCRDGFVLQGWLILLGWTLSCRDGPHPAGMALSLQG